MYRASRAQHSIPEQQHYVDKELLKESPGPVRHIDQKKKTPNFKKIYSKCQARQRA